MRLYEIDSHAANEMILEGLTDSIKKALGNKVDAAVRVVNNVQSAMVVLYRVCTNPQYLNVITTMILKSIRQKLKALKDNPIFATLIKGVYAMMPETATTAMDFIKAIVLCGLVNAGTIMLGKLKDFAKDAVGDPITEFIQNAAKKIFSLDTMLSQLADVTGLFKVIKAFGIADQILFQTLSNANSKIESVPVGLGAQYAKN